MVSDRPARGDDDIAVMKAEFSTKYGEPLICFVERYNPWFAVVLVVAFKREPAPQLGDAKLDAGQLGCDWNRLWTSPAGEGFPGGQTIGFGTRDRQCT